MRVERGLEGLEGFCEGGGGVLRGGVCARLPKQTEVGFPKQPPRGGGVSAAPARRASSTVAPKQTRRKSMTSSEMGDAPVVMYFTAPPTRARTCVVD